MDTQDKIDLLVDLAKSLQFTVRYENMGGSGGGICTIRGKQLLFVDLDADSATAYERLLLALADNADIDAIYLKPEIRQDLDYLRR